MIGNPSENDSLRPSPVSTRTVLLSLGFSEDADVFSDDPGGLSLDFGNFKLSAHFVLNRFFMPVVVLAGNLQAPRSLTEVRCEVPREVDSWEQGAAWVTWCLNNHARGLFTPAIPTPWLSVGRSHAHLLPWHVDLKAYAARPCCQVRRDWARLALRTLTERLAAADDDALVTLRFDGEVLTIRCAGHVVAAPATGKAWEGGYALLVKSLRALPKRLQRDPVGISIHKAVLTIGSHGYAGVTALSPAPVNTESSD